MTQKLYLLPVGTLVGGVYRVSTQIYRVVDEYKHSFTHGGELWHRVGLFILLDENLIYPLKQRLQPLSVQDLM